MIDWNVVVAGETEICCPNGVKRLVLVIYGNMVGTKISDSSLMINFSWWRKEDLQDWTSYDPWEDVSQDCSLDDRGRVYYDKRKLGDVLRYGPGMKVWKRKEE